MRTRARLVAASLLAAITILADVATARTLTWARAEDALTLDPHALNDNTTLMLSQQMYEPLLQRDSHGKALPLLAETWTLTSDPLVWEFRLRRGIAFHDGSPFTAADVVFSIARARQKNSDFHHLLTAIDKVEAVDDFLIKITTRGPTPLLPAYLAHVGIMNKTWTENILATRVSDTNRLHLSPVSRKANGTGPFILQSREPGVKTVMQRNESYWRRDVSPVDVSTLVYRPIRNDTERIRQLMTGDVDFVQDVPVNELTRLRASKAIRVSVAPVNKSVFLGLNVGPAPLASASIKDRNPFADSRVRQAINIAINRQAIQKDITLGQSIPTGIIVPPGVNGYDRNLDQIPRHDLARAQSLMAAAGFKTGFSVRLDCTHGRIVRDEAICRTVAAQLKAIGINIEVVPRPPAVQDEMLRSNPPQADFYLTGRSFPSFDSESLFVSHFHTRNDKGGAANATRYSNPEVDNLTEGLAAQVDFNLRNAAIARIWQVVQNDLIYIPLHVQTLAYATKNNIEIPVDIENLPKLRSIRFTDNQ